MKTNKFENLVPPKELIPNDPRFTPGPSLIPESFVSQLLSESKHYLGTSHRQDRVINLTKETQNLIKNYFDLADDYLVVIGNGGATALFDALSLNTVEKSVVHYTNGEFSSKWANCSRLIPNLTVTERSFQFGEGVKFFEQEDAEIICATLNETSTGVQLCSMPKMQHHQLLAIDATSGGGQIPWAVNKTDYFFFSPQKVFASEGGLWILICSPKGVEKIERSVKRYIPDFLNLKHAVENAKKGQVYTTPSLSSLFFLHQMTKKMQSLGRKNVEALGEEKAQVLYGWAERKSYLSCYVKEDVYRSRTVATIDVDPALPVDDLLKVLEAKKYVYGINAYRKLGRNQFRIAFFPAIEKSDVVKLTELLSFYLES